MEMSKRLDERKKQFVSAVTNWGKSNLREFPWRGRATPYEVFIAEVLLKRTTSTAAKRTYAEFLREFPDIGSLANSKRREIESVLMPLGLYRQRSGGLKEAAEYLIENYMGAIPTKYEELIKVPHIGHYTAGAIMSFGFGKPAPIVDSNVRRVVSRAFSDALGSKPTDKKIRGFLIDIVPKKDHKIFNWGLLDLGSLICSYRFQKCKECPLKNICYYCSGKKGGEDNNT